MTRLLDRLEAKQLVRRVWSSDDHRVVSIELTYLTQAGRTAVAAKPSGPSPDKA